MSESKSSAIIVRVAASVLTVGALWALAQIPGLLRWLGTVGSSFIAHLKGTSGLPNWSLWILNLTAIHALIYFVALLIKPKGPNVRAYTQDSFLGLTWRWSYIGNQPHDVWAFCPTCETILVYAEISPSLKERQTILTCETCNRKMLEHEGNRNYLVAKIHRQIDRKIRTGEWEKCIETST